MSQHEQYMKKALQLAKRGKRLAHPNPLVGAVLVKKGEIISQGYHAQCGGDHAEVVAIKKAKEKAKGATLYVTLEPCSSHGKTPPCTDLIIRSQIKKVVMAIRDPDKRHRGKAVRILKSAGIDVLEGVLQREAEQLNEVFFLAQKKQRPFVALKIASSLDGKIATRQKDSKWITSEASRKLVHQLRAEYDGVLIGAKTCKIDQARLNIRHLKGKFREPYKIIFDTSLTLSENLPVFELNSPDKIILMTTLPSKHKKVRLKREKGYRVISVSSYKKKISVETALKELYRLGIHSILVEGGSHIFGSFLESQKVDKLYLFLSPLIIGGDEAIPMFAGRGCETIKSAVKLPQLMVKKVSKDVLFEVTPKF